MGEMSKLRNSNKGDSNAGAPDGESKVLPLSYHALHPEITDTTYSQIMDSAQPAITSTIHTDIMIITHPQITDTTTLSEFIARTHN